MTNLQGWPKQRTAKDFNAPSNMTLNTVQHDFKHQQDKSNTHYHVQSTQQTIRYGKTHASHQHNFGNKRKTKQKENHQKKL